MQLHLQAALLPLLINLLTCRYHFNCAMASTAKTVELSCCAVLLRPARLLWAYSCCPAAFVLLLSPPPAALDDGVIDQLMHLSRD
jgi:hypothetical protein